MGTPLREDVLAHQFIAIVAELRRLESVGTRALMQVDTDEQFAFRFDEASNSLNILVRHMAGTMRSRFTDFLHTDGEKPTRDRLREFDASIPMTRLEAIEEWCQGWDVLFDALRPLSWRDMERTVAVRGEALTVFEALIRSLAHFGQHVGQIVMLAKHLAGEDWRTLTVPRGQVEKKRWHYDLIDMG